MSAPLVVRPSQAAVVGAELGEHVAEPLSRRPAAADDAGDLVVMDGTHLGRTPPDSRRRRLSWVVRSGSVVHSSLPSGT
ncbi:hypothetical protein GCM10009654_18250 [Streptomyces hebeiensis]|uniref:Transposase IS701-like DDE domain-containing protein n=1 Tax=Streptomyces hebeiensis TaxID=229486 RepID=A0ABN1UQF7_9ACTN